MIALLEALFIDRAFVEPSFKSWTNALTALVQLGLLMFIHTLLYHCGPHAGDPIDEPMPTNLKHDEWHAGESERKKKAAAFLEQADTKDIWLTSLCSLLPQTRLYTQLRECDSGDYLLKRLEPLLCL